jgi:hypothetical protein
MTYGSSSKVCGQHFGNGGPPGQSGITPGSSRQRYSKQLSAKSPCQWFRIAIERKQCVSKLLFVRLSRRNSLSFKIAPGRARTCNPVIRSLSKSLHKNGLRRRITSSVGRKRAKSQQKAVHRGCEKNRLKIAGQRKRCGNQGVRTRTPVSKSCSTATPWSRLRKESSRRIPPVH